MARTLLSLRTGPQLERIPSSAHPGHRSPQRARPVSHRHVSQDTSPRPPPVVSTLPGSTEITCRRTVVTPQRRPPACPFRPPNPCREPACAVEGALSLVPSRGRGGCHAIMALGPAGGACGLGGGSHVCELWSGIRGKEMSRAFVGIQSARTVQRRTFWFQGCRIRSCVQGLSTYLSRFSPAVC